MKSLVHYSILLVAYVFSSSSLGNSMLPNWANGKWCNSGNSNVLESICIEFGNDRIEVKGGNPLSSLKVFYLNCENCSLQLMQNQLSVYEIEGRDTSSLHLKLDSIGTQQVLVWNLDTRGRSHGYFSKSLNTVVVKQ
ncbi:hypothetical protein [Croceimicrobium sp.]|uniref:hypothetical protein n=1 Tax=Croceimicrobium sp. TaxID=2828340 RepID=UPI003BA8CBD3